MWKYRLSFSSFSLVLISSNVPIDRLAQVKVLASPALVVTGLPKGRARLSSAEWAPSILLSDELLAVGCSKEVVAVVLAGHGSTSE